MDPILIERIVLVAAGVIAGGLIVGLAWLLVQRRQRPHTRHLRDHFGPEYERALAQHRSRTAAERDLLDRERRAENLELRQVSAAEVERYHHTWEALQRRFVDEPGRVLRAAHGLLEELMRDLGYPTRSFEEEVELVSVHHPGAVQHYRAAHALAQARDQGVGSVEDQRQALIHYRALFRELLEEEPRHPLRQQTRPGAVH